MPQTPYAKILVRVNGGTAVSGVVTPPVSATLQLRGESTVAWTANRFEIYSYPDGFAPGGSWQQDDSTGTVTGVPLAFYSTSQTPDDFVHTPWGKLIWRLKVNANTTGGKDPRLTDDTGGSQIDDPTTLLEDEAEFEDNRFDPKTWAHVRRKNLRRIASGGIGGGDSFAHRVVTGGTITQGNAVHIVGDNTSNATGGAGVQAVHGVAIETGGNGTRIKVRTQGALDASTISLSAGVACAVGYDSSGALVRISDSTNVSGLHRVGWCDTAGNVYVQPYRAAAFDPIEYGAAVDVSDPYTFGTATTDDQPTYAAIIAAMSDISVNVGGTIDQPKGISWIGDDIVIDRPLRWRGQQGMSPLPNSGFMVAPGKTITLHQPGAGRTDGSVIEGLFFRSKQLIHNNGPNTITELRSATTPYPKGYCVIARSGAQPTQFWRWSGGTTGSNSNDLAQFATLQTPGFTVSDGATGHWTAERFPAFTALRDGTTTVPVGYRYQLADDNRFYWEVTVAGILAVSAPSDLSAPGNIGETQTDGTATVQMHTASAIIVRSPEQTIRDCTFVGFHNCAIYANAQLGDFADFSRYDHNYVANCGMGILLAGDDNNGTVTCNNSFVAMGTDQPGAGGRAIWDKCETATHIGNYVQVASGEPYFSMSSPTAMTGLSHSVWINNSAETSTAIVVGQQALWIGPLTGGATDSRMLATILDAYVGCRRLFAFDDSDTPVLNLRLAYDGGREFLGMQVGSESFYYGYRVSEHSSTIQAKWLTFGTGLQFADTALMFPRIDASAQYHSGQAVDDPIAVFARRIGIQETNTSDPQFLGFSAAPPSSGYYTAGSVILNNAPATNGPLGWVCTVTGSPGTWVAQVPDASSTVDGLMVAADKAKLDKLTPIRVRQAIAYGSTSFAGTFTDIAGAAITFVATATTVLVRAVGSFLRPASVATLFLRIENNGAQVGPICAQSGGASFSVVGTDEIKVAGLTIGSVYTIKVQCKSDSGTMTIDTSQDGQFCVLTVEDASALAFDPANDLVLSGYWRASYGGSPWALTASLGSSAANGNLTTSGTAPTVGTAQNGYDPAAFNGTTQALTAAGAGTSDLVTLGAGSIVALVSSTTTATAGTNYYDDPCILTDVGGGDFAMSFSSSGVRAGVFVGGTKQTTSQTLSAGYHLIRMRWDSVNVGITVDSASEVTAAMSGAITSFNSSCYVGKNWNAAQFFSGSVLELMTSKNPISDADFANIKAYVNSKYGLSL